MPRKRTAAAAVTGALALAAGTTALAAPDGAPLGLFGDRDERRAEHARALGEKLGVDPARVDRALEEVHRERHEAHENELARALAERLDVSAEDAERALEAAMASKLEVRRARVPAPGERLERRDRVRDGGPLVEALAKELDKSAGEVKKALDAIREAKFEARLAEAVKEGRITEEQAKEIRERAESRRGPGFGPPGLGFGPPPDGGPMGGPDVPGDGPGGHGGGPGGPPGGF